MRLVIWGLKNVYHTHRHIHKAFYENTKRLGYDVIWVEDDKKNQKYIKTGDIIIASEVHGKMIPKKNVFEDYNLPVRNDIKYCLHNYSDTFKIKLDKNNYINLAVYQNEADKSDIKIDELRYFNSITKTLYQPWGTDLLFKDFKKPIFNKNRFVFWIGSIWNNEQNQGNIKQIDELKKVLSENNLKFKQLRFIPDFLNVFFIRRSRIAPAIAGQYQVNINYLPCRMFKNISYGQLGITNVQKFSDILGDKFIINNNQNTESVINKVLNLSREEYKKEVLLQQEKIKNYTYKESIENIIQCLNQH